MIISFQDLNKTLQLESNIYPKQSSSYIRRVVNRLVTNPINTQYYIYKYVKLLRYSEYHHNNSILNNKSKSVRSLWHTFIMLYYYWRLRMISYKTGIQIPPNTCGPGLKIWHYGYIIINEATKIGKNLSIYPGVEIGHKVPGGGCPIIGDNCFIGAGAKIFGKIRIGNNVTIAPNSVVTKDVPNDVIVGGIPSKIIKYKNDSYSD